MTKWEGVNTFCCTVASCGHVGVPFSKQV